MTEILGEINNYLLIGWMAVASTSFVILYWVFFDWWVSREGRAAYIAGTSLMLLVDLSILFRFLHPTPLEMEIAKLVVYSGIAAGFTYKLTILIRAKLAERRRDEDLGRPHRNHIDRVRVAIAVVSAFLLAVAALSLI